VHSDDVTDWVCGIILVIAMFNSLYYTKQSVSNAAISHMVATFSELTGVVFFSWPPFFTSIIYVPH